MSSHGYAMSKHNFALKGKVKTTSGTQVNIPLSALLVRMADKYIAHEKAPEDKRVVMGAKLQAARKNSKFTPDQIRDIRKRHNGRNTKELAAEFNVSVSTLGNIVYGAGYAWVI